MANKVSLNLINTKLNVKSAQSIASKQTVKLENFNSVYDEIDYSNPITGNGSSNNTEKYIQTNGDVDGDGKITINDANLLNDYVVESVYGPIQQTGDVNNDGITNIKDVTEIKNYIGKLSNNAASTLSYEQSYTDGSAQAETFQVNTEEPDPAIAINYWSDKLNSSDFVYPKDSKTGESLGAWPKNYQDYPTQLSDYKTYANNFIWPTTPEDGTYHTVYQHNGFDIMSEFGSPVYSPVDGVIEFSSWGDTPNKGTDETAYTVTIRLEEPIVVNGTETQTIDSVFLGHLSGIRYRVDEGSQTVKIKKGELLGFVGNAAGSASDPGWGPHLHLSYFNNSIGYDSAFLWTDEIEQLYEVKTGSKIDYGK